MQGRQRLVIAFVVSLLLVVLSWSRTARAERELIVPFHEGGHVVLDQLSGLRIDPTSGFAYAGPVGIASRSTKSDSVTPGGPASETSTTSLWFAPSADFFVTDHLSLGGRIEDRSYLGCVRERGPTRRAPRSDVDGVPPARRLLRPVRRSHRDRPRAGLGWSSVESVTFLSTGSAPSRETFRAMILDVDLSLVYRFGETFFMRAGPEVGVTLGGRRTVETGGTSAGGGASVLNISGVVGFGMNLEL